MTRAEAIKVLENDIRVAEINDHPYEVRALQLGIEALKRIERLRDYYGGSANELLPGETEI